MGFQENPSFLFYGIFILDHQLVGTLGHSADDAVHNYEAILFREKFPLNEDIYSCTIEFSLDDSVHNELQQIKNIVNELFPNMPARIESLGGYNSVIKVPQKIFVSIQHDGTNTNSFDYDDVCSVSNNVFEIKKSKVYVSATGNPTTIEKFSRLLRERMVTCKSPQVEWHYMVTGRRQRTSIFLENEHADVKKEYYPWLNEEPNAYIDRFMKSDCGLLILRGEPGTGKTSFIRNILWHCDAKAMITYEEELFKSDDLFVEFLTQKTNILIMEDADALIESRIQKGNTSMTKFLNVSDGLIKFPKKKLIISANTIDNNKIDEALLRPGRCFDAPIFRRLSYEESIVACNAAGIVVPKEERTYSLAELFSNAKGEASESPKSGRDRIGFGFSRAAA